MLMFKRKQILFALILVFVLLLSAISFAVYEPFKIEFTLFERFVALGLLPTEGNYLTLKIVRELQMELAPTEEEAKLAELFEVEGGGTDAENWDAVAPKEIIFGDIAKGIIVAALEKLDKEEKLLQQHFTLYEKFILEKSKESKEGE